MESTAPWKVSAKANVADGYSVKFCIKCQNFDGENPDKGQIVSREVVFKQYDKDANNTVAIIIGVVALIVAIGLHVLYLKCMAKMEDLAENGLEGAVEAAVDHAADAAVDAALDKAEDAVERAIERAEERAEDRIDAYIEGQERRADLEDQRRQYEMQNLGGMDTGRGLVEGQEQVYQQEVVVVVEVKADTEILDAEIVIDHDDQPVPEDEPEYEEEIVVEGEIIVEE